MHVFLEMCGLLVVGGVAAGSVVWPVTTEGIRTFHDGETFEEWVESIKSEGFTVKLNGAEIVKTSDLETQKKSGHWSPLVVCVPTTYEVMDASCTRKLCKATTACPSDVKAAIEEELGVANTQRLALRPCEPSGDSVRIGAGFRQHPVTGMVNDARTGKAVKVKATMISTPDDIFAELGAAGDDVAIMRDGVLLDGQTALRIKSMLDFTGLTIVTKGFIYIRPTGMKSIQLEVSLSQSVKDVERSFRDACSKTHLAWESNSYIIFVKYGGGEEPTFLPAKDDVTLKDLDIKFKDLMYAVPPEGILFTVHGGTWEFTEVLKDSMTVQDVMKIIEDKWKISVPRQTLKDSRGEQFDSGLPLARQFKWDLNVYLELKREVSVHVHLSGQRNVQHKLKVYLKPSDALHVIVTQVATELGLDPKTRMRLRQSMRNLSLGKTLDGNDVDGSWHIDCWLPVR